MDVRLEVFLTVLVVLGVLAQWISWTFRIPSIVLLLGCGIAFGVYQDPDVLFAELVGGTPSMGPRLLFPLVSLAVGIILFEGGLQLRWIELREAGLVVVLLCTLGVAVSWTLTSLLAWWLLPLEFRVAALLGAILVVTGPTVIGPLLRQIQPQRKVASILKWEGILIDPIGAVLAVLVFEQLVMGHGASTLWHPFLTVLRVTIVGLVVALIVAAVLSWSLRRYWIPDYLHGAAFLAAVLAAFTGANVCQDEAGLVAVTVLGILLANTKGIAIQHVVAFKEHLQVLLISCLFILLGARLSFSDLVQLGGWGLLFLTGIILVVRPAAVLVACWGSDLTWRERVLLGGCAPRGIVAAAIASVFALKWATVSEPANAVDDQGELLVTATFMVILGTVVCYGAVTPSLARWLGLADRDRRGVFIAGADQPAIEIAAALQENGVPVRLVDTNYRHCSAARMLGIPTTCASILSEHVLEEMDLSGMGRFLAMTSNEELNSMAAHHLAHLFGRANVYRLADTEHGSTSRSRTAVKHPGRVLFEATLTHDAFSRRLQHGWVLKQTSITPSFSMEDFRQKYGDDALVLLVVEGDLPPRIATAEVPLEPQAGQSIIALVRGDR